MCRVLKHKTPHDRDKTADRLRKPLMTGGMEMRHFMCMTADTFFNAHTHTPHTPQ